MMGAKKKPLEVLTLADLGLPVGEVGDAGSKTTVLGLADPPGRIHSVKVKDEGDAARIIVDLLVEKQLA
jgi:electron transfer flavoprotein beta subunit